LFLSRWFPYPPDNGARLRIFNLLRSLAGMASVDLLAFHSEPVRPEMLEMGLKDCRTVAAVPYQAFQPLSARAVFNLLNPKPRSVVMTHSREMARRVKYALSEKHHDLVIVSQRDMVGYLEGIVHPPALLEELELAVYHDAYFKAPSTARRLRAGLTWMKTARYYRKRMADFAASTVVSAEEKEIVQRVAPRDHRIEIIPNGIDLRNYRAGGTSVQQSTILYCGSITYQANLDAVCYFLENIFPRILAACPQAKLRVTGALKGVDLDQIPRDDHVEFTGYIEDIRPVIASSTLSIVPLRIGGGTRLKILESLALGTPVVATGKGAQGLAIRSGEGMLVTDSPELFSQYVIDLIQQPELRQALSAAARLAVRAYDWNRIGPKFSQLVLDLVHDSAGVSTGEMVPLKSPGGQDIG